MPRLFLGCPIPTDVADQWQLWFADHLVNSAVRVVGAGSMHVTILFIGETPMESAEKLVEHIAKTFWRPHPIASGQTGKFGRSAIAVELLSSSFDTDRLIDTLGQTSLIISDDHLDLAGNCQFPGLFYRILPFMPEPELERWRRSTRFGHEIKLHCTAARLRRGCKIDHLPPAPPSVQFDLDRLVLYESILGSGGSTYKVLTQARPYAGSVPLDTERLEFRTWEEAGEFNAAILWCDPQVTRYIGGPFDLDYIRRRLAQEKQSLIEQGVQYWPVYLREAGAFVGCCGIRYFEGDEPWLGFHFLPAHWGRGLAIEAASAVIEFARRERGFDRLIAGHHPENVASRKVIERLGFSLERAVFYEPTGVVHLVHSRSI